MMQVRKVVGKTAGDMDIKAMTDGKTIAIKRDKPGFYEQGLVLHSKQEAQAVIDTLTELLWEMDYEGI